MGMRRAGFARLRMRRAGALDTSTAPSVADWSSSAFRHFMVDGASGDDTRAGYSDTGPTAALALRTIGKALSLIPLLGCGRQVVLWIAAGTYAEDLDLRLHSGYRRFLVVATGDLATANGTKFGSDAASKLGIGMATATGADAAGYKITASSLNVTAIAINANLTARCTAANHGFATGDKVWIDQSGTTQGMCGVCGSYTITVVDANTFDLVGSRVKGTYSGSGITVKRWKVTKADGSAPGFTDDESNQAITGKRLRYAYNAPTSALQNSCRAIWANGTDTIIPSQDLAATPTSSDIAYIEQAGVVVNDVLVGQGANMFGFNGGAATTITQGQIHLVGLRMARLGAAACTGQLFLNCCEVTSSIDLRGCAAVQASFAWQDDTLTSRSTGVGIRQSGAACTLTDVGILSWGTAYHVGSSRLSFNNVRQFNAFIFGSSIKTGIDFNNCGVGAGGQVAAVANTPQSIGTNSTALRPLRIYGASAIPMLLIATGALINGVELINAPSACLSVAGIQAAVTLARAYGSRGNAAVGVDLVGGQSIPGNKNVFVGVQQTGATPLLAATDTSVQATGVYGDFRLIGRTGFCVGAWADVPYTTFKDVNDGLVNLVNATFGADAHVGNVLGVTRFSSAVAIEKYRVVRPDTNSFAVSKAQADTANNCRAIGVTIVDATDPSGVAAGTLQPLIAVDGPVWVQFDRSGAHPAPTVNAMAYVSVDTAGLAQADAPAAAATNQKLRLGRIAGLHTRDADVACVILEPDNFPVLADGAA